MNCPWSRIMSSTRIASDGLLHVAIR